MYVKKKEGQKGRVSVKREPVVGQLADYVPEGKQCGSQMLRGVRVAARRHHEEAPAASRDQVKGCLLWRHCCHRTPPDFSSWVSISHRTR